MAKPSPHSALEHSQFVDINERLNKILSNQNKIMRQQEKILGEEEKLEDLEEKELRLESEQKKTDIDALRELAKIETQLRKSASEPMKHITRRDLVKGTIGAFFGVISHFAFAKATKEIAPHLDIVRTTLLYIIAFAIIILMLYYTGFRKVQRYSLFTFLPLRATILYCVSILVIIFVNLLFGEISFPLSFVSLYKVVGASIILAVLGAGTADLIGRSE
ncbi:DUF2391 family protein [Candidatus Woesearchaeota archaeon]|nr:DUF2391 family protein [Nanoarchaeota archaeon]MCB9370861.1 DUF2391 family protein [Candidatus Woesearchaeota archaeon]USN43962.1 MAG: DUF2391 family protein [Candidatus Woesearchaeota archaeon]